MSASLPWCPSHIDRTGRPLPHRYLSPFFAASAGTGCRGSFLVRLAPCLRLLVMKRCGVDWSDDEWLDEARRIRRALAALGDHLPPCLPNEPGARGQSTRSHYASYCVEHKARAQLRIERDLPHPDPRITGTVVDDSHLVRMRCPDSLASGRPARLLPLAAPACLQRVRMTVTTLPRMVALSPGIG